MNYKNLIIGAGPAGLAIAGRLRKLNIPFTILESSREVGHSWRNHYDRLHLHTIKKFSHLPHTPFPAQYPQYVSKADFVRYLEHYCSEWSIAPQFGKTIAHIEKLGDHWQATTQAGETFKSSNVIVATGYNRVPVVPHWEGMEEFARPITHSRHYRNAQPFIGKNVLVVGMGNTGAEIALDLAEHGVQVSISLRSPINIVPRDFFGRPTQLTAMQLRKLPPWLADRVGLLLREITVGNLKKYGIKRPKEAPNAQVRKYGKIPVIDLGTVAHIKQGTIHIVPDIVAFQHDTIEFTDSKQRMFDAVILATGYTANLQNFVRLPTEWLTQKGTPTQAWYNSPAWNGLYFIGFNTAYTGILNSIFVESERIVGHIFAHRISH